MPETSESLSGKKKILTATSLARWPWVLPFFILLLVWFSSPNFRWRTDAPRTTAYGSDFLQDWGGGWIVQSEHRERLYDLEYSHRLQHDESLLGFQWPEEDYYPVVYPPFHYVLVVPFSTMPYRYAVLVASILSTLVFAVSVWLLARFYFPAAQNESSLVDRDVAGLPTLTGNDQGDALRRTDAKKFALSFPGLMIALCLFLPWIACLSMGQKSTVLLLLFTGTFLMLKAERHFLAGLLFGLVAIKPQLGLLIGLAMIVKQQWSFVAGAGLMVGTLTLVSYLIEPTWWSDYFAVVARMGDYSESSGYLRHDSHSLWGGLKFSLPGIGATSIRVIGGLLAAMVLACVGWRLRGAWTPREARFDSQFAMLVLATLLLSPHLFGYDLTLVILPLVIIVSQIGFRPTQTSQRWLLVLCVAFFVLSGSFARLAMTTGVQLSWILMFAILLHSSSITKAWLSQITPDPSRSGDSEVGSSLESSSTPAAN